MAVSGRPLSRRAFLRQAAGIAAAVSVTPALAGCSQPPSPRSDSGLARQDRPIALPLTGEPIDSGLPIERGATLRVYGWPLYVKPGLLRSFEEEAGVRVEWTDYNSMDEALARLRTGQEQFDVFFPTVDVLGKLASAGFLQPLNHDYLPNRRHLWDLVKDPFYDRGSRYTVPYFVWTTGIAWRNDRLPDAVVRGAEDPYDVFWRAGARGRVHLLSGSREALAMALIRDGVTDVNTGDPQLIERARDALLDLADIADVAYDHEDYEDLWTGVDLHQSWSGNIGFARYYAPDPADLGKLSYWWPPSGESGHPGVIGSDTIVLLEGSGTPVAAHHLMNFLLDPSNALDNVIYEGYQQPLVTMEADVLIEQGVVLPTQRDVIVRETDFARGLQLLELTPSAEALWQEAYAQVTLGTKP